MNIQLDNVDSALSVKEAVIYNSLQDKTKDLAEAYAQTDQLTHRYLAYRDLPNFIKHYLKGINALDYGTGTGISAQFLHNLGLNVVGIDKNSCMLEKARDTFPHLEFFDSSGFNPKLQFDLVFSCFVLFDMKSKDEIVAYLKSAASFMKKGAIFIGITGSEQLYSTSRKWTAFEANFKENRNLKSGDVTKLKLKNPVIEFFDYYWIESDYVECFQEAKFNLLTIHKPIGSEHDPFEWEDEKFVSPFTIYIVEKQ